MAIETTLGSFEGALTKKWKGQQLFRVIVTGERLACVKIGGALAGSAGRTLWHHLGLIGALIGYFVEKRAAKKREAERPQLEQASIDELLTRDPKNNFQLQLAAIDKAELSKPSMWTANGAVARLTLTVGLEQHAVGLASRAQAQKCKELLETPLNGRLNVSPKLKWLAENAPIA